MISNINPYNDVGVKAISFSRYAEIADLVGTDPFVLAGCKADEYAEFVRFNFILQKSSPLPSVQT